MDRPRIMAFGAHAGDMELAAGGALAKHAERGDEVAIIHLTLGEKGHPKLSPEDYGGQKRREALEAAKELKASVRFLPYKDAELPVNNEVKFAICDLIRELKPDIIITHWKGSLHKDHVNTYHNVMDGLFYASLPSVKRKLQAHRVKAVYFTENWENSYGFEPEVYIDISNVFNSWLKAINSYAFARGETGFPYIDYYKSLARIRGIESGFTYAEAFMIQKAARRRNLQYFPY